MFYCFQRIKPLYFIPPFFLLILCVFCIYIYLLKQNLIIIPLQYSNPGPKIQHLCCNIRLEIASKLASIPRARHSGRNLSSLTSSYKHNLRNALTKSARKSNTGLSNLYILLVSKKAAYIEIVLTMLGDIQYSWNANESRSNYTFCFACINDMKTVS